MNPQNDSMLNDVGKWEHAINCYTGQDPLDLWFQFICWLESNLKNSYQGLEEKFRKSVETCLSTYDKFENYKQDLRMVKLWIKYIDFQPNPLNLYKILYQQGIGTKCAAFYIGWAHYYNSANHFKQAESIFNLGLQLKAEPLHEIETAQKNFRFSVAQRMLYNDESSKKRTISSLEEQRQQITSLSPHQNQMPAAKRIRTDSHNDEQQQYINGQPNGTHVNMNNINPVNSQQLPPQQPQTQLQPQYQPNEYQQYANTSSDPLYAISSSLSYVFDDTNGYASIEEQAQQPQQQPEQQKSIVYTYNCGLQIPTNFINYASNSLDGWSAPLYLEEPYDVNRRCFYPKHLVYPGDGNEYSLEELKAHKWRLKMEEKRRQEELRIQREIEEKRLKQEQEAMRIRQEQEAMRIRQEQERLRQEAEARRLLEEQERIRKEEEAQRLKMEQEKLQRQQEEEQRNRERYNQSQMYQLQQQQQQQRWYHHNPHQNNSPANYGSYYSQSSYENSPQYSYVHDHQYQTHYSQTALYQHSPQSYQNSPNYHNQQSVIVNRSQYENHHHQQQHYYMNYPTHSPVHQQPQPQHPPPPLQQPQHHYVDSNYHHQPQPPQTPQQHMIHQNQLRNDQRVNLQQPVTHQQNHGYSHQQPQQSHKYDSDYQDVEYLIDHQGEIDPEMLQQPIVEKQKLVTREETDESFEDEEEEEEEQIPTIVNSYMLDDLEEQIEASTISFSSNGKSRDKKLTIKFRKEKTTTTIVNSESNSESSSAQPRTKAPLEAASTSSSTSSKKKKNRNEVVSYDGENTQFMPSATNSCSSITNGDLSLSAPFGKITFNGCVTPIRKQAASKTSTPISSSKYLKNKSSFISNQNDDSVCSYIGDQNSVFQADTDDDFKSRRLEKALATIDEHMNKRDIDPFNTELCRAFLVKLNFPNRENTADYKLTSTNLPKIQKNQLVPFGGINYQIEKEVGKGSYGSVYRGVNLADGSAVALKYQRPSNLATWELYVCTEVKKRIKNADILPGFMSITAAVIAPNASVLISEFSQYGSLLDINNRIRQATTKVMHESLAMHFASQILNIIAYLHDCKIIHGDIKPDNFLLMTLPSADTHIPSLRLIDFGCAIDMKLFKEGQEFRKIIETDGFTCVEMQEGRMWSYQTDLFCIAGTIHVMLFGEYMQVNKKFGNWEIKQKFPRYLNKTLWTDVFSKLLNIKDRNHLPNLRLMKASIDREINDNELNKNIRTVSNLIRKR